MSSIGAKIRWRVPSAQGVFSVSRMRSSPTRRSRSCATGGLYPLRADGMNGVVSVRGDGRRAVMLVSGTTSLLDAKTVRYPSPGPPMIDTTALALHSLNVNNPG